MSRLLAMLLVAACGSRTAAPTPVPSADAAVALPAPPASHVIVRGDTLDEIARARYGSRHYSSVIALVNGVDAAKLRVGATLRLPSIEEIAAPLSARVPDGAAALLRAHATWRDRVEGLWDDVRHERATAPSADLAAAASDVAGARAAFAAAGAPIAALKSLGAALDGPAGGHVDPYGYDLDGVDRRFASALTALLAWADADVSP